MINRFKTKPEPVLAVKWDGTNESDITHLSGGGGGDVQFSIKREGLSGAISFGNIALHPGDWLVKDEAGKLSSYDPVKFEEKYVPDWPVTLKD